jgi:hypothetical protein
MNKGFKMCLAKFVVRAVGFPRFFYVPRKGNAL